MCLPVSSFSCFSCFSWHQALQFGCLHPEQWTRPLILRSLSRLALKKNKTLITLWDIYANIFGNGFKRIIVLDDEEVSVRVSCSLLELLFMKDVSWFGDRLPLNELDASPLDLFKITWSMSAKISEQSSPSFSRRMATPTFISNPVLSGYQGIGLHYLLLNIVIKL